MASEFVLGLPRHRAVRGTRLYRASIYGFSHFIEDISNMFLRLQCLGLTVSEKATPVFGLPALLCINLQALTVFG
jgi:hypothetical protein